MFRYLELESSARRAEARKIVLIAGSQSTSVVESTAKRQCWLLGVPL